MCVCVYIYIYIYIYTHTYTHTSIAQKKIFSGKDVVKNIHSAERNSVLPLRNKDHISCVQHPFVSFGINKTVKTKEK